MTKSAFLLSENLLEEVLIGEELSHGNKVKRMIFYDGGTTNSPKQLFAPEIIFFSTMPVLESILRTGL